MQPIVVYDINILFSSIGWGGTPFGSYRGIPIVTAADFLEQFP